MRTLVSSLVRPGPADSRRQAQVEWPTPSHHSNHWPGSRPLTRRPPPAGSHGYGVADLNFLKGCDDSFGAAAAEVVEQVVAVPAGATEAHLRDPGQTLSGGALTVMGSGGREA